MGTVTKMRKSIIPIQCHWNKKISKGKFEMAYEEKIFINVKNSKIPNVEAKANGRRQSSEL